VITSHCTETASGVYRHVTWRGFRYPVVVELRDGRAVPVRDDSGSLLYATPGGGRATLKQLLAAA
jgi:hypothetical protein